MKIMLSADPLPLLAMMYRKDSSCGSGFTLPWEPQYMNCVSGMTASVNRGLSGSGFQPAPSPAADASPAAAAGPAVTVPRAATLAPVSPAVRRNARLFGPFDGSGDGCSPP